MRHIFTPTALVACAAAAFAFPALADTPVTMKTHMTGAAEVPGPGAPQGAGDATIKIDTAKSQLCYMLTAKGSDTPTMAHVHKGATGVAGDVVVKLDPPATGHSMGCATVPADTLAAILATPSDYYVNVHSATYPKGAMRGQLGK